MDSGKFEKRYLRKTKKRSNSSGLYFVAVTKQLKHIQLINNITAPDYNLCL